MEKIAGINWALAKVIKEARLAKGFTQDQLAGFAGLSERYIASLEQGTRGDSINALVQIAEALETNAAELMRRVEEELKNGIQKPTVYQGRPKRGRY